MSRSPAINRVSRSKAEAVVSYNRMSNCYDFIAASERKYKLRGLETLAVTPGEKVLEIGFGTGKCLLALARSVGPDGSVHGIDLSPGMCELARRRVAAAQMADRVELICGDAAKLPFEAQFFDAVFCSFTLELFDTPEIPVVLDECRRVLRSEGRICVVAMARKERSGLMVKLYEWSQNRYTKYVDCRPIYVQKALDDSRFKIESVEEMSMFGLPVDIVLSRSG